MRRNIAIITGKIIASVIRKFNIGSGSTWPGHIALFICPQIIPQLAKQLNKGMVVIAGTNGKTTTSKMITTILENQNYKVINNQSGANLLNGIASELIINTDGKGNLNVDIAVFEVDEATLPHLLKQYIPKTIVLLNLFRDQLDRYGEINILVKKWSESLKKLTKENNLILNCDDPQIAILGEKSQAKILYFGLDEKTKTLKKLQHASDSTFCPKCKHRLIYDKIFFSHLGYWTCLFCHAKKPIRTINNWEINPLPGIYNQYNAQAAVTIAHTFNIPQDNIKKAFSGFTPAFGRQEEIELNGTKIKIFLSKNPTGFNESIRTLTFFKEDRKIILLALNDKIPDGCDISWIWDVDFEALLDMNCLIIISGDRAYDLALRLKYAGVDINNVYITINLDKALKKGIEEAGISNTLYVFPTYSAMLEIRSILTGTGLV